MLTSRTPSDGTASARESKFAGPDPFIGDRSRIFHTFDGLRGVAAAAVVIYHYRRFFGPLALPGGYLAVDLFFMMSGVVVSRAYEARLKSGLNTLAFVRLRLIRLYPLYLLGTTIGLLIAIIGMFRHNETHWDATGLLFDTGLAFLTLPDLQPNPANAIFPLNPPGWSLFFELFVNILYAAVVPLLSRRRLIIVCVVSAIVVALTIAVRGDIDVGHNLHHFVYGFARTLFGFSLGVIVAHDTPTGPPKDGRAWPTAVIFGAAVIALIASPPGGMRAAWDALCLFAVFPAIVYFAVRINPPRAWLPAMTFLGLTSYALYVLHAPLIGPFDALMRSAPGAVVARLAPLAGFLMLACLFLLSWLADRYFDTPLRQFLGRSTAGQYALKTVYRPSR